MQVNMTLEYSTDDGEVLASTLARMLNGQLPISNLTVSFRGRSANIILATCDARQGAQMESGDAFTGTTSSTNDDGSTLHGASNIKEYSMTTSTIADKSKISNGVHTSYIVTTIVVTVLIGMFISALFTSVIIFSIVK